jgi:hypothetical protein
MTHRNRTIRSKKRILLWEDVGAFRRKTKIGSFFRQTTSLRVIPSSSVFNTYL